MAVQDTSLEVYYGEVKPNLGENQLLVLNAFRKSKRPVNNQEIADFLGMEINKITPRTKELRTFGLVELACKAVYPKTNRKVMYWRIKK